VWKYGRHATAEIRRGIKKKTEEEERKKPQGKNIILLQPVGPLQDVIFGKRTFVKRFGFALSYWTVVCPVLSCLSACNVGVLRANGWTDKDESWHACRPRTRSHCVRWGPSFPQMAQPPNFRPMSIVAKRLDGSTQLSSTSIYGRRCKTPQCPQDEDAIGTEVSLGPGDVVLDGDPAPPKRGTAPTIFRPMSIVAKRLDG